MESGAKALITLLMPSAINLTLVVAAGMSESTLSSTSEASGTILEPGANTVMGLVTTLREISEKILSPSGTGFWKNMANRTFSLGEVGPYLSLAIAKTYWNISSTRAASTGRRALSFVRRKSSATSSARGMLFIVAAASSSTNCVSSVRLRVELRPHHSLTTRSGLRRAGSSSILTALPEVVSCLGRMPRSEKTSAARRPGAIGSSRSAARAIVP